MFTAKNIKAWFLSRRPKPLNELLSVQCDDDGVKILVLDRLYPASNQDFAWGDIARICFKDGGLYSSDFIIIQLRGREPVVVPTEAAGGSEFLGALAERGYFPEEVWRRAVGETGGGIHCWPPLESKTF